MPIATVEYCILCEGVRPEQAGKATILGFVGVLPFARLVVRELQQPLGTLMFLVGLHGPSDEILLRANLKSPDGSTLIVIPEDQVIRLPTLLDWQSAIGGVGFANLAFTQEGVH